MDQARRPAESEGTLGEARAVSRRTFLGRARLGLIALAGVTVFGIATTTSGVVAKEDEEEKKEKEKPRDKDREAKEKERQEDQKEKKSKKKESSKNKENKSNNKKNKKNKNGDSSEKKKATKTGDSSNKKNKKKNKDKAPESPYAKYIVKKEDKFGCKDFPNQFDAQQVLRIEPKDPNGLDGNRNGIACDGQDAFMDGVAGGLMNTPFDLNPVSRPTR